MHTGSFKIVDLLASPVRKTEFSFLKARMIIASQDDSDFSNIIALLENEFSTPEPFSHQDRILDWYKAGTAAHLAEANETILKQMRNALDRK